MSSNVFHKLAFKLINLMNEVFNKEIDVPYMQRKYKATRGMILGVHITHTPNPTKPPVAEVIKYFKLDKGKAVMMDEADPDAVVWCELNTMLNLVKGEITREYNGRKWKERFTPLHAWAEGKVVFESKGRNEKGWLSDLELFSKEIYSQVFPIIKDKIGDTLP